MGLRSATGLPGLAVISDGSGAASADPRRRALVGMAIAGAFLAAWAAWAVLTARPAAAQDGGTAAVNIIDFDFDQKSITVPVGTTLTWTNTGERPHTATDRAGTFDTQSINPGATGSVALSAPGSYSYFCRINPSKMNGTIVVTEGPTPSPAVRVQTIDPGNIEGEKLRFDPPELEVAAGTTLLVANVGGKPHSFSAEDGSFDSGIVQPGPEGGRFAGSNATLTLTNPGTFKFFCQIHPQAMTGTVVVTGSPPATTPAPASSGARNAQINIADFEFEEPEISVGPGAELLFRNIGEAPHTATFDDVNLDTGNLDTGGSATLVAPTQPGSYSYFCNVHTRMRGVVVVLGQNTADPAALPNTTIAAAAADDDGGGEGTDQAAPAVTVAPGPPLAYSDPGGLSGAMKGWVLATVVVAAFLGGVGLTAFLSRRRSAA